MSARSHVDVNERRLRPIYDCLDFGNNKKAIQEADKVLKKHKDFQCAKILKGLALLRFGRQTEGTHLLHEVHSQNPTDEATLQAMAICYKELNRLDLLADMYANAHKAKPDNEDVLTGLFMAYVCLRDYKKQQQTAMILHRLRPAKNPYYFWAIMSIVMQAHADPKLAKTMFLPLAERMTNKYVADKKIEAEAEVKMYLIILEELGKYEEALKIINGPLGDKLNCELNFKEYKNIELLSKLERWPDVNIATKKLLRREPDQWTLYKDYFLSLLKLFEANWVPEEGTSSEEDTIDHTITQALTFLDELKDLAVKAIRPIRGPYLARLELYRLCMDHKVAQEELDIIGKPLDLIMAYFSKYGDKACYFGDIHIYLPLLNTDNASRLLELMQHEYDALVSEVEQSEATNHKIKVLQRHICICQLNRHLGYHRELDVKKRLELCEEFMVRHEEGLENHGKLLMPTEQQHSDPYLLMAVHILYDSWEQFGNDSFLWQAIILLEKGLANSSTNFQLKLHLIQLYAILGAFGPCTQLYESLDIKHIQNDSLGYLIANHVGRLGHFSSAGILYDAMLRFFTLNHKDTTEYLISSYKYGSFTKVQEFVRFRERLQNSLQYASATTERLILDMTLETNNHDKTEDILIYMDIDPEKDRTVWCDLRDNRDLNIVPCWDPPKKMTSAEIKKKSFEEEKAWLKVRNLMVRCAAASVKLGLECRMCESLKPKPNNSINNGSQDSAKSMADVLRELLAEFTNHLEECKNIEIPQYHLTDPARTRLRTFLLIGIGQLIVDAVQSVLYCYKLLNEELKDTDPEDGLRTGIPESIATVLVKNKGPLISLESEKPCFHADTLENLVHLTETLGFMSLFVGVCHRILKPVKIILQRQSKKKKESLPHLPGVFEMFAVLVEGLEKCVLDLRNTIRDTDPSCLAVDLQLLKLADSTTLLDNSEETQLSVWKKMEKSCQDSAKEIETYLENKAKYLSTLRL